VFFWGTVDLPPGSRKNQQEIIHRKGRGVEDASSQTLNESNYFAAAKKLTV
jgi:hypothetical protein